MSPNYCEICEDYGHGAESHSPKVRTAVFDYMVCKQLEEGIAWDLNESFEA